MNANNMMTVDDGLYHRPDEDQTLVILEDVKKDTSKIASLLEKYGGGVIAAPQIAGDITQPTNHSNTSVTSIKNDTSDHSKHNQSITRIHRPSTQIQVTNKSNDANDNQRIGTDNVKKKYRTQQTSPGHGTQEQVKATNKQEGKARNAKGQFVAGPNKVKEAKEQGRSRKIIDAIRDAGKDIELSGAENLDPAVDAIKELSGVGAFASTFIGKFTGFTGSVIDMAKNRDKKESKFRSLFKRKDKREKAYEENVAGSLEEQSKGKKKGMLGMIISLFGFLAKALSSGLGLGGILSSFLKVASVLGGISALFKNLLKSFLPKSLRTKSRAKKNRERRNKNKDNKKIKVRRIAQKRRIKIKNHQRNVQEKVAAIKLRRPQKQQKQKHQQQKGKCLMMLKRVIQRLVKRPQIANPQRPQRIVNRSQIKLMLNPVVLRQHADRG